MEGRSFFLGSSLALVDVVGQLDEEKNNDEDSMKSVVSLKLLNNHFSPVSSHFLRLPDPLFLKTLEDCFTVPED